MRSIRVYLAALAAVIAGLALMGGLATTMASANTASVSNKYSQLKKQRDKQMKKCNLQVRKAKKQVRKAKKTRNKAKIRKANKKLRTAKRKSKSCVKKAKKNYTKKLKQLAPQSNSNAPYSARGSVGDAYVKDAKPGTSLMLVNSAEKVVARGVADQFGSKIFYDMKPGAGYSVRTRVNNKTVQGTKKFPILKPGDNPKQSFYENQVLDQGLNYLTMRDGTEIAVTVRLPMGMSLADGPFPTYIEYSGYETAAPHDLLNSFLGAGGNDPLVPASSTAVGALIGPLLDFATVSVQMRGSGCSGGAFDLFGWPTTFDGYDVIEAVAAQDWVKGNNVGMGGISFSGITQLFVAGTQPPHLGGVAPLSVSDDMYQATGFPGGIFNDGFAYSWISERANDAQPAPAGGQRWARELINNGDPDVAEPLRSEQQKRCLDNQKMRLQTRDFNQEIEANPFRNDSLFEKRAPGSWVKNIDVPIFWVGAFQDEQTGGHWVEAVRDIPASNPDVWVTMQNGVHVDSLGPSTITRMAEFMNLFIGEGRVPKLSPLVLGASATLYGEIASAGALDIQQTRFAAMEDTPANVAAAKATFRQDPRVRILMDNGNAVEGDLGAIGAAWETGFSDWPVPNTKATEFFLGEGGSMTGTKSGTESSASYVSDPSARPARSFAPGTPDLSWRAQPPYDWKPLVDGKGLGFVTPALSEDVFIAGPSSVDLYLKSNKANTDLQVTLTEVRPDGKETYVQNGWLRATHRAIDENESTAYNPVQTWQEKDSAPLESNKYNYTRVQIFPAAHVFRAGSKIRLNIQAPGGDRTIWNFQTIEDGTTTNTIGLGGAVPSKLVLPVIPGQTAQGTELPAPTALRGQPSRDYTAAGNGG